MSLVAELRQLGPSGSQRVHPLLSHPVRRMLTGAHLHARHHPRYSPQLDTYHSQRSSTLMVSAARACDQHASPLVASGLTHAVCDGVMLGAAFETLNAEQHFTNGI